MAGTKPKPRLAVWKFASCDGCQLSLLDCEDELLAVAGAVDIAYFPEATRGVDRRAATIFRWSRARSRPPTMPSASTKSASARRRLVTIGACATAGGIQALRNFADVEDYTSIVYARPDYIETLATSTPIRRSRPGRFRAARLSDQQAPAARGHFRLSRRTPARDAAAQRLHRVQAQGQCLRDGGARHALPRAGDACRLRRALPVLRPRLLWLLRPDGNAEHARR